MSSRKSTIGRSIALRGTRAFFGAAERFAPDLGARLATRLWLTVPRFRGRPAPVAPGRAFDVDGVTGTTWGEGPVVYLVHGWGGARVQLHGFVAPLVAAGYQVVAHDSYSHGTSSAGFLGSRRTTIPEMAAALTKVVAAHGPAHAAIAHSAGCSATFFALRDGLRPERLVFIAPMTRPDVLTARFAAGLGFGDRILTRLRTRIATLARTPWDDFDMPVLARRIAVPPLLVTHDEADAEVTYGDSVALAAAWPGAELVTVSGLGHRRILKDPATIERATGFVHSGQTVQPAGVAAADAERQALRVPGGEHVVG